MWACERFHLYLYGMTFELVTDHKPLEIIYSEKSKPSAHIERCVLRLQPYTFKVRYIPGRTNIADPLSRLTMKCDTVTGCKRNVAEEYIRFVAEKAAPKAVSIREIERESDNDLELADVRHRIEINDWKDAPTGYKVVRNELTTLGKLVLRGTRIVMPQKFRRQTVKLAHEGHQGIVKTKARLRTKVWWPGIDREAEEVCRTCHSCQLVSQPTSPTPIHSTELPKAPWVDIAADLMGPIPTGEYFFVVVDYYSRYAETKIMKNIQSQHIMT